MTRLLLDSGVFVVAALIAPFRAGRRRARGTAGTGRLMVVFVDAPLAVCQRRDPKGLYVKARAGKITGLTGVDAPYESPEHPAIHLRTDQGTPEAQAKEVIGRRRTAQR